MKKTFLLLSLMAINPLIAQVGINTNNPQSSFHVKESNIDINGINTSNLGIIPEGIIAPNLTGDELKFRDNYYSVNQKGALVYVTTPLATANTSDKTVNVTIGANYYYFDGEIWQRFITNNTDKNWFYLPSFNLDLSSLGSKTVNLYDVYKTQFSKDGNNKFVSNNSTAKFVLDNKQVLYLAEQLDFFVTDYDENIIKIESISDEGIMKYEVKDINPPINSFINVILNPKSS